MGKKPEPKCEVAITFSIAEARHIGLHASADAIAEFEEFGEIVSPPNSTSIWLFVDSRYDFADVLEYIKSYG